MRLIADRAGFSGRIAESAAASPRSLGDRRQVADIGRIGSIGWVPAVELDESVDALVASLADPGSGR